MSDAKDRRLPLVDQDDDLPVCGPAAYVSNEEAAVVAAMRRLKEEADLVRTELRACDDATRRDELEARLRSLRADWQTLSLRREQAYRRKMIMLGHMEPDEVELR